MSLRRLPDPPPGPADGGPRATGAVETLLVAGVGAEVPTRPGAPGRLVLGRPHDDRVEYAGTALCAPSAVRLLARMAVPVSGLRFAAGDGPVGAWRPVRLGVLADVCDGRVVGYRPAVPAGVPVSA